MSRSTQCDAKGFMGECAASRWPSVDDSTADHNPVAFAMETVHTACGLTEVMLQEGPGESEVGKMGAQGHP